jgi:regulator of sirC expression with transglutaminase-like and TPR domain
MSRRVPTKRRPLLILARLPPGAVMRTAILSAVLVLICASQQFAAEPETGSVPADVSVEALTEQVRKSVIVINSAGRDGERQGMGAGFVISADGLVATNFHVIGQGRDIRVQLPDGREVGVTEIHASDRDLDLAILKLEADDLAPLELGNSDELKQGQSVIAFGNPRGFKYSVVSGVVSGVRTVDDRPMIQLAMPIEPGNSGGPLVDRQGRVQGIVTMKSAVTDNLGFALTINLLKPLLDRPNPILMTRWRTIGALDPEKWQTVFGANWRQRAGRVLVDGVGASFGGRSLCLSQSDVPDLPYECTVAVKLDNEAGAAGLAFCADGSDRHYGFYPTGGQLRLTKFEGPDVQSWQILHSAPSKHYKPGGWNTLRVRLENGKIECFLNDVSIVTIPESQLAGGKVGLVKFRDTAAEFKAFEVGSQVTSSRVSPAKADDILGMIADLSADATISDQVLEVLSKEPMQAAAILNEQAARLERQAKHLKQLAQEAHERRTISDLITALAGDETRIDLFRAGLLIARLDNEEVDVDAYCCELDQMAAELSDSMPSGADDIAKLARLKDYLFNENGFHGSRGDYYNRANSYLNEVLDDREGLPITLSIVYMELARRLGVNVVGVGLPGHFVVAYQPAAGELRLIDVFEDAAEISRETAERRIRAALGPEVNDAEMQQFFEPVAKRAIVMRMLQNLLGVSRSDPAALSRYLNAMLALSPEQAQFHLMRAVVRYQLQQHDRALEDVRWILEHEPAGIDLDQVRALQAELERQ